MKSSGRLKSTWKRSSSPLDMTWARSIRPRGRCYEELPRVYSPAPATKISLGSKKTEPSKAGDSGTDTLVPTRLPLTATAPADLSGEKDPAGEAHSPRWVGLHDAGDRRAHEARGRAPGGFADQDLRRGATSRADERLMAHSVTDLFARAKDGDEIHRREVATLKKALAKREQRIKELEGKLKTAEEIERRILKRADLGEKILTDPILLAQHICRGRETGEAVLAAVSRTPIGEDLMYDFGTWAFNSGRRAMQNDVRAALEVSIDDDDLPKILAVLPEEVSDPGPTPFSKVPD
nr:leucine zipper putative tumor suppressor 2-like [Ipomoea batatas]